MAGKPQVPAKRGEAGVATRVSTVKTVATEDRAPSRPVPAFLRGHAIREAPGLSPTVDWRPLHERAEQYVYGYYLSLREGIGPHLSNLYYLADKGSGEILGVWGGVVLDNKMQQVNPEKGTLMLIQYIGDISEKPGQKPARNFRVAVVQEPEKAPF